MTTQNKCDEIGGAGFDCGVPVVLRAGCGIGGRVRGIDTVRDYGDDPPDELLLQERGVE